MESLFYDRTSKVKINEFQSQVYIYTSLLFLRQKLAIHSRIETKRLGNYSRQLHQTCSIFDQGTLILEIYGFTVTLGSEYLIQ